MPRLRSGAGVVVNVSDETAAKLGANWTLVEEPKAEKPASKRSSKSDEK